MSKLDIKDLKINDIEVYTNDEYTGFKIYWTANIGFGVYEIYKNNSEGKWYADTECMDSDSDKSFGKMLFDAFLKEITIT